MVSTPRSAVKKTTSKKVTKCDTVSKNDAKVVPTEPVVAPVEESVIVETPAVVDDEKPVVADKDETNSKTSNESKTESLENAFILKLSSFITKIASINKEVKELQSIGKTLEKDFNNVIKVISKQKNKSRNNENRTLSGFAMPSLLTQELYDFLNIKAGTRVHRKDVTRMLNDYIKSNDLREEEDKRHILPDANLKRIFNCTDTDKVTYFNLQTYLKHHYIPIRKDQLTKPEVVA